MTTQHREEHNHTESDRIATIHLGPGFVHSLGPLTKYAIYLRYISKYRKFLNSPCLIGFFGLNLMMKKLARAVLFTICSS